MYTVTPVHLELHAAPIHGIYLSAIPGQICFEDSLHQCQFVPTVCRFSFALHCFIALLTCCLCLLLSLLCLLCGMAGQCHACITSWATVETSGILHSFYSALSSPTRFLHRIALFLPESPAVICIQFSQMSFLTKCIPQLALARPRKPPFAMYMEGF